MDLRQRIIILDFEEVMRKLGTSLGNGDWLLAIDPETLETKIVIRGAEGYVADVAGHEDLFPLSMAIENPDGFLQGGDWLVAQTPNMRQHDGEYRSYWIDWQGQDKRSMIDQAREFLKIARHDGIAAMTSLYPFIVCYLSHQRVEKFLKAFLAYHSVNPPKTHDLERLIALCIAIDPSFDQLLEDAKILRPYAIDIRYTSDKTQADREAELVWNFSRKVGVFVKRRLPVSLRKDIE